MKPNTANPIETLGYIVDCTMATAAGMAMRKSPSRTQLWRQLNIAGYGIEALEGETDPPYKFTSRLADILILWGQMPLSDALREWAQEIHNSINKESSWKLGSTHSRIV